MFGADSDEMIEGGVIVILDMVLALCSVICNLIVLTSLR
jgi:hypothetical protein